MTFKAVFYKERHFFFYKMEVKLPESRLKIVDPLIKSVMHFFVFHLYQSVARLCIEVIALSSLFDIYLLRIMDSMKNF